MYIYTYTYTYICGYFTAISLLTNGCDVFFVLSPAKACPWFDHFDLSLSCWWFLRLKAFQTPPAAKITTMSTKIHHFQYMVCGVWKLTEPSWPTVEFPLPCLFTGQTVVCCLQAEGIYSKSIQKPFNSHSKKVRDAQVFWPLPPLIWQWQKQIVFLHTAYFLRRAPLSLQLGSKVKGEVQLLFSTYFLFAPTKRMFLQISITFCGFIR